MTEALSTELGPELLIEACARNESADVAVTPESGKGWTARIRLLGEDGERVYIDRPIVNGAPPHLSMNTPVTIYFCLAKQRYAFHTRVRGRVRMALNAHMTVDALALDHPLVIKQGQRRRHYRLSMLAGDPIPCRIFPVPKPTDADAETSPTELMEAPPPDEEPLLWTEDDLAPAADKPQDESAPAAADDTPLWQGILRNLSAGGMSLQGTRARTFNPKLHERYRAIFVLPGEQDPLDVVVEVRHVRRVMTTSCLILGLEFTDSLGTASMREVSDRIHRFVLHRQRQLARQGRQ